MGDKDWSSSLLEGTYINDFKNCELMVQERDERDPFLSSVYFVKTLCLIERKAHKKFKKSLVPKFKGHLWTLNKRIKGNKNKEYDNFFNGECLIRQYQNNIKFPFFKNSSHA